MHGDGMYADGTDVGRRGRGGSPGRGRRAAAILALLLGLVGFAVSMTGVAIQLLPRQFTAGQQRQIEAWEVMRRWQTMPAGQIFPASVSYQLSAQVLQDAAPLDLDALRVSIAPQESDCAKAVTSAAVGAVLRRNGCEAVLRATYVDATRSYVMTVGVAVLPTEAAAVTPVADCPRRGWPRRAMRSALAGCRPASWWSGSAARPPGCTTTTGRSPPASRPARTSSCTPRGTPTAGRGCRCPRTAYSDDEMTSMAAGVARSVANTLAASPAPPHCPGAPGC